MHAFKIFFIDKQGNRNQNPLLFRFGFSVFGVKFIEIVLAYVGSVFKYIEDGRTTPFFASMGFSQRVQMTGDSVGAQSFPSVAVQIKVEDFFDSWPFSFVNLQLFLFTVFTRKLSFDCTIAIRWSRSIEKALASILLHTSQSVFSVLFALIFVKDINNPSDQVSSDVIVGRLSD
nr:hypothetical protein [Malonomonas rubra]